ncbi:hypothetical protein CR513_34114, partial [Mucuna pruriens]
AISSKIEDLKKESDEAKTILISTNISLLGLYGKLSLFQGHSPFRKSKMLELVHYDLCSLMKARTFVGALYFVLFIDDHLRKLWIYVLKNKI